MTINKIPLTELIHVHVWLHVKVLMINEFKSRCSLQKRINDGI